jgi:glycosyltransferase involved in cell wall biosynthesis
VSAYGEERGLRVWLACDWFVKYTAGLARGLSEVGCELTLLTRDHDQEFGGASGAMRAFVAGELGAAGRHLELGGRVRSPAALRQLLGLRRARREWRPDVVHVQDSLANDVRLAFASGLRRGRYALTVHDPVAHPGDAVPPPTTRALRRALRCRAGLVFVHSAALAKELAGTGEVGAPIEVVPHGTAPPLPAPFPERASLLFFGRISHYKGLDVLLDAMPLVWRERPEVPLTIAGEGELPDHPLLADERVDLRAEHVPEREVPALLGAATCVVLPYRQASQSGVGSLARQHGRPVVATAVGGLPELIAPEWGRLVPPEDAPALAEAILEVIDTPGLAEEMGRSAAASAAGTGWREVAALTVEAYRRHLP